MAGYSGTPLMKKLGIKPGDRFFTINAPAEYRSWLGAIPKGVEFVQKPPKTGAELVHLFVVALAELETQMPRARAAMTQDGALWVSWFKRSAEIRTDVTEDEIRARALKADLVDVKVCAVTDIWSGLKLVIRKELRQK
ncbi:MAG TPA: hypothetical protein VL286_05020 [Rhizomicrobium sp.]|jgi:hypothetical protein|nr:hypothetical protein [Rhizomicrobium sp.]